MPTENQALKPTHLIAKPPTHADEIVARWRSLPLSGSGSDRGSEIWSGPEGEPVEVTREEDPDGEYFVATTLDDDEPASYRTWDDPHALLDWIWGH